MPELLSTAQQRHDENSAGCKLSPPDSLKLQKKKNGLE